MNESVLASWRDGVARRSITDFVGRVSTVGSTDYVAPEGRVAVFDNDGTLWCEQPLPIQADFLFRRLAAMVAEDPSLAREMPWKAVVEGDHDWLRGVMTKHYDGDDSDLHVLAAGLLRAYEGHTIEEFEATSREFMETARHPTLGRSYLECAYQPMLELLEYLSANGFTSYIASGGGRDFMRTVSDRLYGIPPDRVIGSSVALAYVEDDRGALVVHTAKPDILDDGPEKAVRIWSRVGRRPILAFGNSNGDVPMLAFTGGRSLPALRLLLNHDDDDREFAYATGAEAARERAERDGWTVVSMRTDWSTVFADTTKPSEG